MKRILLKKLVIQNFKGCRERTIEFGEATNIFGANASGKTTIMDAFCWLMFNKDSSGSEKFNIRPLDSDGKMIDNVEIMVEATLNIDGTTITLQKVQKQNWVKKRGTDVVALQGNINTYEIDSFPASEKEFKEKIASIIPEDLFKLLSDPRAFASLPWKKQREILLKFISEITDADVLATNETEYALIADEVLSAGVEKATEKAKKAMDKLKERQKELPARIDEASKSLVRVPELSDLELQRNALNEQLEAIQKQRDDAGQAYKDVADIQAEIMQTKLDIGAIEQDANAKLDARRREARRIHSELESRGYDLFQERKRKESELEGLHESLNEKEQLRIILGEKWKKAKAMIMDESETVCELCGQTLPSDKIEEIKANFEKNKASMVDRILQDGYKAKSEIDEIKSKISSLKAEIETLKQSWNENSSNTSKAYEDMNSIPKSVDISDNQEYQTLQVKLSNLQMQLGNMDTGESYKQQLAIRERGIREELDAVNKQFAAVESNERVQERIEELKSEQKDLGQKVADQEQKISLLEQFSRTKMNLLSDKINQKFHSVRFRLFDVQINGGIKDTCVMQVNSNGSYVDFWSSNDAAKMQAGLDVIAALSDLYGVSAPVFLDNRESVSEIPDIDGQVINLFVSADDKELRVEVE